MDKTAKKLLTLTTAIIIGIIGIVTFFSSINIVQEGTVKVVRRFGIITDTLTPGGLNMRFSWIHTVETFDIRIREADISFAANSSDAQIVNGHVAIHYRINPLMVTNIVQEFGSLQVLEARLHAMLLQETQNVFTTKTAMELIENRAMLAPEILNRLQTQVQANFHVFIENVALEHVGFSLAFNRAVENRVIADQALRQSELDAARDMVYAQRNLDVAGLEAEAVLVRTRADAEALAIMQDAWGDLGSEVRQIMLQQLAIDAWDGSLPAVLSLGDVNDFGLILDSILP